MDPKAVQVHLLGDDDGPRVLDDESFPILTPMGRELRGVQQDLHEIEVALTFIRHAVNL
jgi:hypothetical protein